MMDKPRYFNKIEILDDYRIRKSSADIHKIEAEYAWYESNEIFCTPQIYEALHGNNYAAYDIEYIHMKTLARYFLEGGLSEKGFENILYVLQRYCTKGSSVACTDYTKMLIHSMYKDKTYDRLAQANINLDESYIINRVPSPTIREIIEDCPVYLKDKDIRHIHGDLCFSNILINPHIEDLYLTPNTPTENIPFSSVIVIDPRGYLPDGTITDIGDVNYDVAKLAHSIIGRYDQIKHGSGFYLSKLDEREYSLYISTTDLQKDIEEAFIKIFSDFDYYNIMIHLFFSMIPLHADRPDHQEQMLINAIRLYLEREARKKRQLSLCI